MYFNLPFSFAILDPHKLYEGEIAKQPCIRYFKGYCKYDLYCRNTHFNDKQLKQLKELIENLNRKSLSTPLLHIDRKLKNIRIPWLSYITKRNLKQLPKILPPSLKPLNLTKLSKLDVTKNKWG